jgi:hypothetical protein
VYINVHTDYSFGNNAGALGLARGQLSPIDCEDENPNNDLCFSATVDSSNTNKALLPASKFNKTLGDNTVTPITGDVLVRVPGAPQFNVFGELSFATGPVALNGNTEFIGAHLHTGNETTNGPVAIIFCGSSPLPSFLQTNGPCFINNTVYGETEFTAEWTQTSSKAIAKLDTMMFLDKLAACTKQSCDVYINVHTSYSFYNNPSKAVGLARGQLRPTKCRGNAKFNKMCYKATVTSSNTNLALVPTSNFNTTLGNSQVTPQLGNAKILVTIPNSSTRCFARL